ncbi:glycine/D-amino acid oxidase-like deaminating enzyme/nitrite reductase/ring-hydroxylating ferredoxin subunit [Pedobacter sp. CG_S7]|uniref:FAD-dependent oxidoreductase n=1 Tax=Pedobacter sp. CG_S7 TaxID=3143930 RepID=UPI00339B82C8
MKKRDSNTKSIWQDVQLNWQPAPITAGNIIYDTLIVGGGITGITTALLLQKAGKNCVLAESKTLGYGTTGGTTAHLNTFFDASYLDIENDFGEDAAKLMALAGVSTLAMIKDFVDAYAIDCDFEYKDAYLYSENEEETKKLVETLAAIRKAGINAVEIRENSVPIPFEMAVLFTNQGQFHPLKYLYHLAKIFVEAGGTILENTFIKNTTFDNGVHIAVSDTLTLKALSLVYATHLPPGINILDFRCAPYRSYVLGLKLKNEDYPDALVYDMQEPYHYFRTHEINGQKYLVLGGEDHKTGHDDPEKAIKNLADYARKYFYVDSIDYQWSSQYYISTDGLPYIGLLPAGEEQLYVATGFGGNGMIFGTLAGKIISDQLLGIPNPYTELLNPSRIKPIAGFEEFVTQNTDVAVHFVMDRLSATAIASLSELEPGTGSVLKYKNKKLAIYKADDGRITALNPVCTHAKCIVNFNEVEKSWDCPCHGGRYSISGEVLNGPPSNNLTQIQID